MKIKRFPLLIITLLLGSLFLSACSGTLVNTWPGLTVNQRIVYLSDQSVYAIDSSNGTMTWRFPAKPDASKPFYAAPAVGNNLIVAGNYGHFLYGIDPGNGAQKWVFEGSGNFVGSPLIINDTILAPSSNNLLYALTLDGKLRWTFEAKNGFWATPASDGKYVYAPSLDHILYTLNLSDGKQVRTRDLGSALISSPVLTSDGILYISTMEGSIIAIKVVDGSVLWTMKTGGRVWSSPALNDNTLYVGNLDGKIFAISAKDGSVTWQKDLGGPVIAGAVFIPDGVVFQTEAGNVVAWSLDGQKQLWSQTINGKLYTTPVDAGQMVVIAVTQGDKLLQALTESGQLAWPFVAPK